MLSQTPLCLRGKLSYIDCLRRRFKQALLQPGMRRGRTRCHPNFTPGTPVDDGYGVLPTQRKSIEKGISGSVIHLASGRKNGADGREQGKEFERHFAKGLFKNESSTHLRIKYPVCRRCGLQQQRTIFKNARGMKDAIDPSIALTSQLNDASHLSPVGNISLNNEQPCSE